MRLLTHNEIEKLLTYEFLYEEYVVKQKSYARIAKENGIYSGTVSVYVKRFGIPSNGFGRKGCIPWNKGLTKEIDERIAALSESRSVNSKKMWQRPGFRERHHEIMNSPEIIRKNSEKTKELWRDPVWRDKVTKSITIANNRPEVIMAKSKRGKELAKDPEIIRKNSESHILLWQDPEWRRKSIESHNKPEVLSRIGKASKERWLNINWREQQIEKIRIANNTPETKEKHSIIATELWKNKEFRDIHVRSTTLQWENEKYRKRMTGINSPMYGRVAPCGSNGYNGSYYTPLHGNDIYLRSSYEVRVAIILDKLGINWNYECMTFYLPDIQTSYHPDFYLLDYDIYWEVKGWLDLKNELKMITFFNSYKNINLNIIWLPDIIYMERCIDIGISFDIENVGSKFLYTDKVIKDMLKFSKTCLQK
jgi:hypothetical protein